MSEHYQVRYRLANGNWNWMDTAGDSPFRFTKLERAEESIQKIVSQDYVIEGEMYDDQETIVQRWAAGPYRSEARRVEERAKPSSSQSGICADSG